ncbi:hypothetical protein A2115_00630 [Candidatus Woesebacteria bacterium GWA1_41_8]|uniref:MurNAc-LAA domain-containing protein n=1 Tax=Candidatus Woesebacteria bacterium GWA1_41_8 TaxID=1802471 RepID=A0A1F7WK66_9BACT|nr:MAG: hypothetical protein A2115_00630 [Candidatus Woesebacteria bacterium GWA1_41_8]
MKKLIRLLLFAFLFSIFFLLVRSQLANSTRRGAPPYQAEDLNPPENLYDWMADWQRPDGPPKVGLQVGHWKNDELPDELSRLKGNTGSNGGGKTEWEVNLAIAQEAAKLLHEQGVVVEILPSTIPTRFWADVFVAIHADGSTTPIASGFKAATPRRDFSGKADKLLTFIEDNYQAATNLGKDSNISRNMRGYYAFAWWRYEHAVHPMTASLILEAGFLTNARDRKLLVYNPEVPARGIVNGIMDYLMFQGLLNSS